MKILLVGAAGKMGGCAAEIIKNSKFQLAATLDKIAADFGCPHYFCLDDVQTPVDVVLDFSNRELTAPVVEFAANKNIPAVIATTGQTEDDIKSVISASQKIPIFMSANMSFGAALFTAAVERFARAFPYAEVEISEVHHSSKQDVPSGTALMLANAVRAARGDDSPIVCPRTQGRTSRNEIGISSSRVGATVGKHTVVFDTGFQSITLCHEAKSRDLFAIGALNALSFIVGKPAGLYGVKDILLQNDMRF